MDQKKKNYRRQSTQQKKGKWVSGEGLLGDKTVKVDDRRERGHSVHQERSFADVVSQGRRGKPGYLWGIPSLGKWIKL